jgi:peroxiredoxin
MRNKKLILSVLFLFTLLFAGKLYAQERRIIKDFSLTDVFQNKKQSLSELRNHQAIVVIFTNTQCPYAKLYDERIKELAGNYLDKNVAFLLINPSESTDKMTAAASRKGYNLPYLADTDQKVSKMFQATKTPEAFLLIKHGADFLVTYQGAIDDNPQVPQDVNEPYLRNAIEAALQNQKPEINEQRATGCLIKSL